MPQPRPPRFGVAAQWAVTALVLVAFGVWLWASRIDDNRSADFLAVWLAGQNFATGEVAQIYPPQTEVHTMQPPPGWEAQIRPSGYAGPVYPFLYPPLWAWVAQKLFGAMSFAEAAGVMVAVNAALMAGSILLAARATRSSGTPPLLHAGVAMSFVVMSMIGVLAMFEGQPQILVVFLSLLAMERVRAGDGVSAGVALALAASIKLYPALFALALLAGGHRRGFVAFLGAGAALGLASIAVAGWPMHAAFLHHVSTISASVFASPATVNLDGALAQLFFRGEMTKVASLGLDLDGNPLTGWSVMARPLWWSLLSKALILAATAASLVAIRRGQAMAGWALMLTLVPLVSPLGWLYYFLPAALLAPALIGWLGTRSGLALAALGVLPTTALAISALRGMPALYPWLGVFTTLGMALWAIGFALASARARD